MKYLVALSLLCSVLAQDTYNCPDGWEKEEDRSGCRCFLISETEAVTRDDADVLCAYNSAWVAELDHPGKVSHIDLVRDLLPRTYVPCKGLGLRQCQ